MKRSFLTVACLTLAGPSALAEAVPQVNLNKADQTAAIQDQGGHVRLRLNWASGCFVDQLEVRRREVLNPKHGMFTGIKAGGHWYTSRDAVKAPIISVQGAKAQVSGIEYGGGGVQVRENWLFKTVAGKVFWLIDRSYLSAGTLEDSAMPTVAFYSMDTWTGAVLGTGGVAWCKLFDMPNATYGIHTDSALFWNANLGSALKVASKAPGQAQAIRFTREPDGAFTMSSEVTGGELLPASGLARYRRTNQALWSPLTVSTSDKITATFELSSPAFAEAFGRGDFKGLDTGAITELLNTIGRIGVVDDKLVGTNGWYSGYTCLHEPWIAQVGIALNDPNYIRNYARCLDYQRDHAINSLGMVKSRWTYGAYDAQPGTYDPFGFYETQWGRLMDTQSSYVSNVADLFDLNGDVSWVKGQKAACESVLAYLLKRDTNGNHLVEMENDSMTQKKSSDWLDITWASFENAFVNAQLYGALLRWSRVEQILGDKMRATYYADYAEKLKESFNKPTSLGGFWNPEKGWYAYWREKDGSIHGDNLTLPVNLTALGEGLCDSPMRQQRLLKTIEEKMEAESLLSWPSCFLPFGPGECANTSWPDYENGDIFLAWAELGIRSYAETNPSIAVKYVRKIVEQYKKDGLAFQRYLRKDGQGAGDDILSNNCNAIVGLYRDIYGIQPKYNRLYLDPHLTPELNGTVVNYDLRGKHLKVLLSVQKYQVQHKNLSVSSNADFGVDFGPKSITLFNGSSDTPCVKMSANGMSALSVDISGENMWSVKGGAQPAEVKLTFFGLARMNTYAVRDGRRLVGTVSAKHPTLLVHIPANQDLKLKLQTKRRPRAKPGPT